MIDEYAFEARLYDKVWGKYDYDTDVKFLDQLFRKHRCRRIIDIGCGTGNHAVRLNSMGYEMTAVDVSPAMLRIVKSKAKDRKMRIKLGDMKKLASLFPEEIRRSDITRTRSLPSEHGQRSPSLLQRSPQDIEEERLVVLLYLSVKY